MSYLHGGLYRATLPVNLMDLESPAISIAQYAAACPWHTSTVRAYTCTKHIYLLWKYFVQGDKVMDTCLLALHARSNCSFILTGRNGKMNDIRHDILSPGTLKYCRARHSRVCLEIRAWLPSRQFLAPNATPLGESLTIGLKLV